MSSEKVCLCICVSRYPQDRILHVWKAKFMKMLNLFLDFVYIKNDRDTLKIQNCCIPVHLFPDLKFNSIFIVLIISAFWKCTIWTSGHLDTQIHRLTKSRPFFYCKIPKKIRLFYFRHLFFDLSYFQNDQKSVWNSSQNTSNSPFPIP